MPDPWFIGPKLRYWRKRRGISAQTLGGLVGRSHSWVTMAEQGRRAPYRLDDLVDLAAALRVDLGTFVCTPVPGVPDPAHQQVLGRLQAAFGGRDPRSGLANLAQTIGLSDPGADLMLIVEPAGGLKIVNRREALQTGGVIGISLALPPRILDPDQSAALATSIGKRKIGLSAVQSLRSILNAFRHLDDQLGSAGLRQAVLVHLRLVQALRGSGRTEEAESALRSIEAEFAQFAGWLAFDACDYRAAERYLLIAYKAADSEGDEALAAHVLHRMGYLASYQGDWQEGVRRGEAASARAAKTPFPALRAVTATTRGRAYAKGGNVSKCMAALDEAEADLNRPASASNPECLYYFSHSTLDAGRGIYLALLGDHLQAQSALRRAVASIPAAFVRDKSFYQVWLATSLADAGEIPEACRVGNEVVDLLNQASSRRTTQHLQELDAKLVTHHRGLPEVRTLHERVVLLNA